MRRASRLQTVIHSVEYRQQLCLFLFSEWKTLDTMDKVRIENIIIIHLDV